MIFTRNLIIKVVTKTMKMKKADAKKKTDFGTLRPVEPAFSSQCDFAFKVRVKMSAIKAKWIINVIDRLIYIVSC